MKICFATFACPEWTIEEIIEAAGRHNYYGVEIRCDANHAHGVEVASQSDFREYVQKRFSEARLEIPCLSTSLKIAELESMEEAVARVELAADINAKALRVFCGPSPPGMDESDVISLVGTRLRALAQLAEPYKTEIWLETHDTLHRAVSACSAVRIANHPLIGINYDNMHPYRMHESLDDTFSAMNGLVRHTHMHDALADDDLHSAYIVPLDEGEMPMDEMFRRLVASGYNDYLGGEWFETEYGRTPDEALASFRRQMDTLASRNEKSIEPC